MKTCQGVKKRAFPTVRIANETYMYLTFINNTLCLGDANLEVV